MKLKIIVAMCVLVLALMTVAGCAYNAVSPRTACENAGGQWGILGNLPDAQPECNDATPDAGKECNDSSECKSYCQAPKGSEIDAPTSGTCYGFQYADCMQEVRDGIADAEWCI